jgi:hypothetical protein
VNFVNAHPFRSFKDGGSFQFRDVLIEHASDSALRNANITGYAGEGLIDGLLAYPSVKTGCHALSVDNIGKPLGQGLATIPATEATSLDVDTHSLSVHRQVFNQYLLPSAAYYVLRTAGKAGLGRGRGFSVQVIFMVVLFGGKDVVSGQVKDILHGVASLSKGNNETAIYTTVTTNAMYKIEFLTICLSSIFSIGLMSRYSSNVGGIKPILKPSRKFHFAGVVITKFAFTFPVAPNLPLSAVQRVTLTNYPFNVHIIPTGFFFVPRGYFVNAALSGCQHGFPSLPSHNNVFIAGYSGAREVNTHMAQWNLEAVILSAILVKLPSPLHHDVAMCFADSTCFHGFLLFLNDAADKLVNILLGSGKGWIDAIAAIIVTNNVTALDEVPLNLIALVFVFCFHDFLLVGCQRLITILDYHYNKPLSTSFYELIT